MAKDQIRFDDGAAYERYMGMWSQLAGNAFLAWLAPEAGLRWLELGCGNGAFTEMLIKQCAPGAVLGIDPSEAQLAYARSRSSTSSIAHYRTGDAMALPFADDRFDAAIMPLVVFFVPKPAQGVAEMARVVTSGGIVAAYAWDLDGGGFPYQSLRDELQSLGHDAPQPPSPDASRLDALHGLWTGAGLTNVETQPITVKRRFSDFDDYWTTILGGPSVGGTLAKLTNPDRARLQHQMRQRLPRDAMGNIQCTARANAVKGYVAN